MKEKYGFDPLPGSQADQEIAAGFTVGEHRPVLEAFQMAEWRLLASLDHLATAGRVVHDAESVYAVAGMARLQRLTVASLTTERGRGHPAAVNLVGKELHGCERRRRTPALARGGRRRRRVRRGSRGDRARMAMVRARAPRARRRLVPGSARRDHRRRTVGGRTAGRQHDRIRPPRCIRGAGRTRQLDDRRRAMRHDQLDAGFDALTTRLALCPREESDLRAWFRKPLLYPLSYGGAGARIVARTVLADPAPHDSLAMGRSARRPVSRFSLARARPASSACR